jgi:hypothetical protein
MALKKKKHTCRNGPLFQFGRTFVGLSQNLLNWLSSGEMSSLIAHVLYFVLI